MWYGIPVPQLSFSVKQFLIGVFSQNSKTIQNSFCFASCFFLLYHCEAGVVFILQMRKLRLSTCVVPLELGPRLPTSSFFSLEPVHALCRAAAPVTGKGSGLSFSCLSSQGSSWTCSAGVGVFQGTDVERVDLEPCLNPWHSSMVLRELTGNSKCLHSFPWLLTMCMWFALLFLFPLFVSLFLLLSVNSVFHDTWRNRAIYQAGVSVFSRCWSWVIKGRSSRNLGAN